MPTKEYCVYNETRENFLSSRVTFIDTKSDPLKAVKVLIEGLAPNAETGLWLNPLKSMPTIPRLSSYDLVYLDRECRVVHGVALVADDEVPPFDGQAASALVLPIHSFSASHTHPGDQVILYAAEERQCAPAPEPVLAHPVFPAPAVSSAAAPSWANLGIGPREADKSFAPPAPALQPLEVMGTVLHPERKLNSSKLGFLRSIVHLRVHISVSICLAPAVPGPIGPSHGTPSPKRAHLTAASVPCNQDLLQSCVPRKSVSNLSAAVVKHTAPLARKYASLKISYLRWAEDIVYRPARVSANGSMSRVRRVPCLEEEC
jgi:hypothetical protein